MADGSQDSKTVESVELLPSRSCTTNMSHDRSNFETKDCHNVLVGSGHMLQSRTTVIGDVHLTVHQRRVQRTSSSDDESGMVSGESCDVWPQSESSEQISESGHGEVQKSERLKPGVKKTSKSLSVLGERHGGYMQPSEVDVMTDLLRDLIGVSPPATETANPECTCQVLPQVGHCGGKVALRLTCDLLASNDSCILVVRLAKKGLQRFVNGKVRVQHTNGIASFQCEVEIPDDRTLAGPATIFLRSCESELSLNAIQHRKLDFFIAFQPYTLATSIVPREDDHDEQTDGEGGSGPCRKHTFCPKSGSTDTSSGSSTYQASKPSSESDTTQDSFYLPDDMLRFAAAEYLAYKLLQREGKIANLLTANSRSVDIEVMEPARRRVSSLCGLPKCPSHLQRSFARRLVRLVMANCCNTLGHSVEKPGLSYAMPAKRNQVPKGLGKDGSGETNLKRAFRRNKFNRNQTSTEAIEVEILRLDEDSSERTSLRGRDIQKFAKRFVKQMAESAAATASHAHTASLPTKRVDAQLMLQLAELLLQLAELLSRVNMLPPKVIIQVCDHGGQENLFVRSVQFVAQFVASNVTYMMTFDMSKSLKAEAHSLVRSTVEGSEVMLNRMMYSSYLLTYLLSTISVSSVSTQQQPSDGSNSQDIGSVFDCAFAPVIFAAIPADQIVWKEAEMITLQESAPNEILCDKQFFRHVDCLPTRSQLTLFRSQLCYWVDNTTSVTCFCLVSLGHYPVLLYPSEKRLNLTEKPPVGIWFEKQGCSKYANGSVDMAEINAENADISEDFFTNIPISYVCFINKYVCFINKLKRVKARFYQLRRLHEDTDLLPTLRLPSAWVSVYIDDNLVQSTPLRSVFITDVLDAVASSVQRVLEIVEPVTCFLNYLKQIGVVLYSSFYRSAGLQRSTHLSHSPLEILDYGGVVRQVLEESFATMKRLHRALCFSFLEEDERPTHPCARPTKHRDYESVQHVLVLLGASPNVCNKDGQLPIHEAFHNDPVRMVELFLQKGIAVDSRDQKGGTRFHSAAATDSVNVERFLLENGHGVEISDTNGKTYLYIIVRDVARFLVDNEYVHESCWNYLKQIGAVLYSPFYRSPGLHYGGVVGQVLEEAFATMERRLETYQALCFSFLEEDESPTHPFARPTKHRDYESVQYLLLLGASPNICNKLPIHEAFHNDHVRMVELFLQKGVAVDSRDQKGGTRFHSAAATDSVNVGRFMLENGHGAEISDTNGKTPLHITAEVKSLNVASLLVDNECNVHSRQKDNWTPLHIAAQYNSIDVAWLLLDHNWEIDARTVNQGTPVHVTAWCNSTDVARLLLKYNCDARQEDNWMPLHVTAQSESTDLAQLLLEHNCEVYVRQNNYWTALHIAALNDYNDLAELLPERITEVEVRTEKPSIPLHVTAKHNSTDVARLLLEQNCEVDAREKDNGIPLRITAQHNYSGMAQLLLEHNCQTDARQKYNWTPLDITSKYDFIDVARLLQEHNCGVDAGTEKQLTLLHFTAQHNSRDVARLLLEHNCEAGAREKDNWTSVSLYIAAQSNSILEDNSDVDARDKHNVPLHFAARRDYNDLAQLLLEHHCVDARTEEHSTPLHITAKRNSVALLLEHNCVVDARHKDNGTPLHIAAEYIPIVVAQLLLEHNIEVDAREKHKVPLLFAVMRDYNDLAEWLLEHITKVVARTEKKSTPLHFTAQHNSIDVTRLLQNCEVDARKKDNGTPLCNTAQHNSSDMAQLLLEHNWQADARQKYNWTPLDITSKYDFIDVAHLLQEHNCGVDARTEKQSTPLHFTAQHNSIGVAQVSLEQNCDVDAREKDNGTPLHITAQHNSSGMARLLQKHNYEVCSRQKDIGTPLRTAQHTSIDVAPLLLDYGCKLHVRGNHDVTALHLCAHFGHSKVAGVMILHGRNLNAVDSDKTCPLFVAGERNHGTIVTLLLQQTCNPSVRGVNAQTAIHHAVSRCMDGITVMILEGANPNFETEKDELTPLHTAAGNGNLRAVRLLPQIGALINAGSKTETTPLHTATIKGRTEIVKFLLERDTDGSVRESEAGNAHQIGCHLGPRDCALVLLEGDSPGDIDVKLRIVCKT